MTKQRLRDWGRRALIVLLLVSALLLLRRTGYDSGIRQMLSGAHQGSEQTEALPGDMAGANITVLPLAVTVCAGESAGRFGAAFDETAGEVFRRFSLELGEALGSADSPAPMTAEDLHAAMSTCGVCFRFATPLPLQLLAGWLGTDMSGGATAHSAVLVCLSATETETVLSYQTPEGDTYRCATAAKPDGLRTKTAEYPPNDAIYSWESEDLGEGESLLLPQAPVCADTKSAVVLPAGTERDALLRAVGMNSFVASSYTESDGTVVYVNEETTLRLNPTGTVFFRRAASPEGRTDGTLRAAVNSAWRVAEGSIGLYCGDGRLYFSGAEYNESQQTCTVLLDYMVRGIPVRLADGHAAEIVLRGEGVIQARLQYRQFQCAETQTELLPYLQAAAIAAARGRTAEIVCVDAGDATQCIWVIADG